MSAAHDELREVRVNVRVRLQRHKSLRLSGEPVRCEPPMLSNDPRIVPTRPRYSSFALGEGTFLGFGANQEIVGDIKSIDVCVSLFSVGTGEPKSGKRIRSPIEKASRHAEMLRHHEQVPLILQEAGKKAPPIRRNSSSIRFSDMIGFFVLSGRAIRDTRILRIPWPRKITVGDFDASASTWRTKSEMVATGFVSVFTRVWRYYA